ncbi:MAG: glutamate-5-semialdehyde dehydrogenase [Prevotellaceae bacterium]|jgi:glutamate-5-semialdehyde dehydrogenase|nr:glutamate-5-semialdehyde dehydrogenase [Prevotellaceae bacterium]
MEQQFYLENLNETKKVSRLLPLIDEELRCKLLTSLADRLESASDDVVKANKEDLKKMSEENPMFDRLLLNESRIKNMAADLRNVASLDCPLWQTVDNRIMPNGLEIQRISVPMGVVAVIYESRPNVTLDVFALCFKSGNACVLKGGKEADESNKILVKIIQESLEEHKISKNAVYLYPSGRENTLHLLNATGLIDVCIPRGSKALIDFVRSNAKIPVIETGAGVVHTYFDADGDLLKGRRIINNAKTRRVSVCNALDCLIVHRERIDDLFALVEDLLASKVEILADKDSFLALNGKYPLLKEAQESDFGQEFLGYRMSIKTVNSLSEAVEHITHFGTQHSEAIISENLQTADEFLRTVDAAVVYHNAPTSFTDGAQFGLGAEIGISTQKLHARGPMSLNALTSYKWTVKGNGQVRD